MESNAQLVYFAEDNDGNLVSFKAQAGTKTITVSITLSSGNPATATVSIDGGAAYSGSLSAG